MKLQYVVQTISYGDKQQIKNTIACRSRAEAENIAQALRKSLDMPEDGSFDVRVCVRFYTYNTGRMVVALDGLAGFMDDMKTIWETVMEDKLGTKLAQAAE